MLKSRTTSNLTDHPAGIGFDLGVDAVSGRYRRQSQCQKGLAVVGVAFGFWGPTNSGNVTMDLAMQRWSLL
jgi:hypothetical protein